MVASLVSLLVQGLILNPSARALCLSFLQLSPPLPNRTVYCIVTRKNVPQALHESSIKDAEEYDDKDLGMNLN